MKTVVEMNGKQYVKYTNPEAAFEIPLGYEYELQSGPGRTNDYYDDRSAVTRWKPVVPEGFNVSWDPMDAGISGWEIRSLVAPLRIHKILFKKMSEENDRRGSSLDQRIGPLGLGAGIHVHIEQNVKTKENAHKVFNFLHSADRTRLHLMSGRDDTRFNRYAQSFAESRRVTKEMIKNRGQQEYNVQSHYGIINTESEKTFEMRMFAARPELIPVSLEACDSLFRLSKDVDTINFDNWYQFTAGKEKYKELREVIARAS